MSVGLLVVRLLYRFYVCVHLSKWFTLSLLFGRLFVVCTVVLPLAITHKYTNILRGASITNNFFTPLIINMFGRFCAIHIKKDAVSSIQFSQLFLQKVVNIFNRA